MTVWRDSFGSALLPWLSEAYAEALFTRITPQNAWTAVEDGADNALWEIAQRSLRLLPANPPAFPAPAAYEAWNMNFVPVACEETEDGTWLTISGSLPQSCRKCTDYDRIFLRDEDGWLYEACPVVKEDGTDGFLARFFLDDGYESGWDWEVAVGIPKEDSKEKAAIALG